MTLVQLRYFLGICEYKSMAQAALALSVSQPSLSLAVKELENELGVELFLRMQKKLILTQEGMELRKMAADIIARSQRITDYFSTQKDSVHRINIGMSNICNRIFSDCIRNYNKKHENVELVLFSYGRNEVEKLLSDSNVDLIVIGASDVDDLSMFNTTKLGDMCVSFYTNVDNPLSKNGSVSLEELADEPLIIFAENNDHTEAVEVMKAFMPELKLNNIVSYTNQLSIVSDEISSGKASAIISNRAIPLNEKIMEVPMENIKAYDITAVWSKKKYLSNETIRLLGELELGLANKN